MSILTNQIRVGNFTSSEIYNLVQEGKTKGSFGARALSYIQEKNFERELGRSLNDESTARPLLWGKLLEKRCFDILPTSYTLSSDVTIQHPKYDFWCGSRDGMNNEGTKAIVDIKCPFTLKSFCILSKCKTAQELRENHKDGEKFYWQLVSNSIIADDVPFVELITYMPFKSELIEIGKMIDDLPIDEMSSYYFIKMAREDDLPFLLDNGKFQNKNILRFEVPQSDRDLLEEKVLKASEMLIPW